MGFGASSVSDCASCTACDGCSPFLPPSATLALDRASIPLPAPLSAADLAALSAVFRSKFSTAVSPPFETDMPLSAF